MNEVDIIRLRHRLEAAQEAVMFAQDETRTSLANDRKLILALAMEVTIIGEAASRLSKDLQNKYPDILWSDIVSTRNYLVHAYFKIDLDVLWSIVSIDLVALIPQLKSILDNP